MVEITLKRQARDFAEKYDVSYTRALAAVDEPLHRLRDALVYVPGRRHGFMLTDSEDELLDKDEIDLRTGEPVLEIARRIHGTDFRPRLTNHHYEHDLLEELSRRTRILDESKVRVRNFWEQRKLYRAGLSAHNLDPQPIYYRRSGRAQELMEAWDGIGHGLFEVAVLQDEFRTRMEEGRLLLGRQADSFLRKKITWAELQELLHPSFVSASGEERFRG